MKRRGFAQSALATALATLALAGSASALEHRASDPWRTEVAGSVRTLVSYARPGEGFAADVLVTPEPKGALAIHVGGVVDLPRAADFDVGWVQWWRAMGALGVRYTLGVEGPWGLDVGLDGLCGYVGLQGVGFEVNKWSSGADFAVVPSLKLGYDAGPVRALVGAGVNFWLPGHYAVVGEMDSRRYLPRAEGVFTIGLSVPLSRDQKGTP